MRRLPLFTSSAHPASPFTSYGSTASPTHNSCTPYTPGKLPLAASRLPGFPASRFRPAPAVSPTSAASPPCRLAALPPCRLAALPPCRVGASPPWRVGATPWSLASAAPWPSGRRAAGARGAQMSGVAGGAWARVPGKTRPRKVVSRIGHSRAHMALNRHFSDHFVRFVHRFSAISERRLSPRENRLVCAARRWLTCTGPPRRCRAKRADAQALALTPHQALSRARWRARRPWWDHWRVIITRCGSGASRSPICPEYGYIRDWWLITKLELPGFWPRLGPSWAEPTGYEILIFRI